MVNVRVGDYDRFNGVAAKIFLNKLHSRLGTFAAHQRVKHYPARVALDDRKVRHVIATHLIDALTNLKQPVRVIVLCVLPKAGINRIGRLLILVNETVCFLTPYNTAVLIGQHKLFGRVNKSAYRKLRLPLIAEIKLGIYIGI